MKDSPAIILASGLAGMVGAFFPTASGWILEQSFNFMGWELSAQSLGLFTASRLLYLPPLFLTILGAVAMSPKMATRKVGVVALLASLATLTGWLFQKSLIDRLSEVGVGPSIGLFLLLVSGLGGLAGSLLLTAWPPKQSKS